MREMFQNQISEFFAAAGKPYSYNLLANIYIWFGILWGLPIPLVTMFLEYRYVQIGGQETSFSDVLYSPIQLLFLLHPIIFGILFGILGTIRQQKDNDLATMIKRLKELSTIDTLTGLKNRRAFIDGFQDECARSLRRNESLSLLFLDIDHFKKVNDQYGHHQGDIVLKEIGDFLRNQCRPYDSVVRWGGEEFLVLLRTIDEPKAAIVAERIRRAIEAGISKKIEFFLTISIGVAQYLPNDSLEALCDRADKALYYAKKTGRNQVVCWQDLPAERDQ